MSTGKIKNNKNNNKNVPKSTGKVVAIALAGILTTSALATAVAYKVNPNGFKNFFNINVEQNLKGDESNKVSEMQSQIDLLKSEKSELQTELSKYKASLASEKELTAEQQTHIQELESAIAEKDTQIATLESLVEQLQGRVDDLESQIGTVTNSVMDKVKTYEMKFDTHSITSVYRFNKYVFISSGYATEVIDTEKDEQKLIYSNSSNATALFYEINNDLYISMGQYAFGKFNPETALFDVIDEVNSTYNKLSGTLQEVINLENKVVVKTDTCIAILENNEWLIYSYKLINGDYIISADANSTNGRKLKKIKADWTFTDIYTLSTTNLTYLYGLHIHNEYAYMGYCVSSTTSGAQLYKVNLATKEATNINAGQASNMASVMYVRNNYLLFASPNYGLYIYNLSTGSLNKSTIVTSNTYYTLTEINGYVFDKTLTFVFNDSTGEFQRATSTAYSTTSAKTPLVVDGYVIRTDIAQYFDENSLEFKLFSGETTDAGQCNSSVQYVNGKLFSSSSNSNAPSRQGVHYIDLTDKTIKKVADSGNGDIVNTGIKYEKSVSVNDSYALIYNSHDDSKYGVLINTDTMIIENVFTNFGEDLTIHNGKIVSGYGNHIKILDQQSLELHTIYSKEVITSLDISFTSGNKVFYSTYNSADTVSIDVESLDIEYYYGVGNVDMGGLKLGYDNYSSTLFDPSTGDILNIPDVRYGTTYDKFENEDFVLFEVDTIVYEIARN